MSGGRAVSGDRAAARRRRAAIRALRYAVLVAVAAVVLFPVYITVVNSLLTPDVIGHRPPTLFPVHPHGSAYVTAWHQGHMGTYLRNSFVVALAITAGQVATSILAGYAFALVRFPLRTPLFVVFLSTLMVPFEATIITNRHTIVSLGWVNRYPALVVPFLATGLGTFLLRQAFLGVPRELQDAARLDGYGHCRFMLRVAVPLARPSVAALGVFSFLGAWNQYLWPLLVTDTDRLRTVQIGLRQLEGESIQQISVTFAGTVLAAVPIFVLLVIFQKQLVRGLTAGAVKG
ncbi:MAG TPA: carbohydrate ABC transporter permease [Acidimicrobiales bacterium]